MFSNHVQLYTLLILHFTATSIGSPLDFRIHVLEDDGRDKLILSFSTAPGHPDDPPPHISFQQSFRPQQSGLRQDSDTLPLLSANQNHEGFHRRPNRPVHQPFIPQSNNRRPTYRTPTEVRKRAPEREEDLHPETSETTPLHLDFGVRPPWVPPPSSPLLPATPLSQTNDSFTTIRCSNTSFEQDVFCDLRTLIPKQLNDVVTKVYYVLLRFPILHLDGTCNALLQPRFANNYDYEDEDEMVFEEKVEDKVEGGKNVTDPGVKETTDSNIKMTTESVLEEKVEDKVDGSKNLTDPGMMDEKAFEDKVEDKVDSSKNVTDPGVKETTDSNIKMTTESVGIISNEDTIDKEDGSGDGDDDDEEDEDDDGEIPKGRKKREGSSTSETNNPLHIFYDGSKVRQKFCKSVIPAISMDDVTHMQIHFYGKELTHLVKLVRDKWKNVDSREKDDGFPLYFTVDDYGFASPVSEGSQPAECRSDGARCRP